MAQEKKQKIEEDMQKVTLRSGQEMPLVGLGCWKIPKDVCAEAVHAAIKCGYRLLDCASDYGNEEEVGKGIKAAIDEGIVKRKDLFITSKLWNTYHAKEHVTPACKKTLADLGLDYVDLYLIHFPISLKYVDFETRYPPEWSYDPKVKNDNIMGCEFVNVSVSETWAAMETLVDAGLAKNIGVSNFNCQLLMELFSVCKSPPSVLQVEHHPLLPQPKLIKFAKSKGMAITGYSSFGGQSYIELGNIIPGVPSLIAHKDIVKIAAKHSKTAAQVCLRWAVQNGIAVIPKSSKPKRLAENLDLFSFSLDDEDMETLKALDAHGKIRYNDPGNYADYPIYA